MLPRLGHAESRTRREPDLRRRRPLDGFYREVTESPPAPHHLEISVFGPGIGECVVVHLGDSDWVVVDSCIDRQSGRPVALEYLRSLGVDVASQIKLVIATHWHDDHIRGIAEILHAAESAKFVNSAAYVFGDFGQAIEFGEQRGSSVLSNERIQRHYRCAQTAKGKRGNTIRGRSYSRGGEQETSRTNRR